MSQIININGPGRVTRGASIHMAVLEPPRGHSVHQFTCQTSQICRSLNIQNTHKLAVYENKIRRFCFISDKNLLTKPHVQGQQNTTKIKMADVG